MSGAPRHLHVIAGVFSSSLLRTKFFQCFFGFVVHSVQYGFISSSRFNISVALFLIEGVLFKCLHWLYCVTVNTNLLITP